MKSANFALDPQADGRNWVTYTFVTDANDTIIQQSLQPGNFDPSTTIAALSAQIDADLVTAEIAANVEEIASG